METWAYGYMETWTHRDMDMERRLGHGDMDIETWTWRHRHRDRELKLWGILKFHGKNREWKTEAQTISLNLFTVYSSCKRKFVVCPFVDEETNGSYPFANGLNGLNGVARKRLRAHGV
jgi:hypothetical protein